jgi:hypothetical protein
MVYFAVAPRPSDVSPLSPIAKASMIGACTAAVANIEQFDGGQFIAKQFISEHFISGYRSGQ